MAILIFLSLFKYYFSKRAKCTQEIRDVGGAPVSRSMIIKLAYDFFTLKNSQISLETKILETVFHTSKRSSSETDKIFTSDTKKKE